MDGSGLAWLGALVTVVVAILILLVAAVLIPRTAHAVRRRFYCPWRDRNVMARFLTGKRGEPLRVLSCTAFADPLIVTCEQRCVDGSTPPGPPTERHDIAAA